MLKSRAFLLALAVLFLILLIFLLGYWLQWSAVVLLIGVITVLVLAIVLLGIGLARASRGAAAIEQSIKRQAEQQLISARPDRRQEVEELKQQLERAIEMLKQSKLGRGRRGRAALYALPWYMFIGPPGAGKTTAITNSGLNFPMGSNRVRGVGGTRNCDWFFSDTAILLDTAGRYVTEPEDTDEWYAFLDTLKRNRSERPINGIIVGISLADLLAAAPADVEWHADTIRRRIDELLMRLGMRFPVYLVFTKCDLLQGFVEFFGELSRKEREQIWGATLDQEHQRRADLRAVFEQEFDQLHSALINQRLVRLSRSMKRDERQKVFAFPLQLASVKDNLALFVARLFQPNPYQESPVFRGFYFTSGTQEGAPIDRVIEAIARQFDLRADASPSSGSDLEAKSYFIKDLFTDVIVPDQYLARRTSRAASRGRWAQAGVVVAASVLLGLLVLGMVQAFFMSKRSLAQTQELAQAAALIRWDDPAPAFERMEALRMHVERLGEPRLLGLGLSRGSRVREPASSVYLDQARAFVDAYPKPQLEQRLSEGGGPIEGDQWNQLYDDLKAYLLLTSQKDRLEEEGNRRFLQDYLTARSLDALRERDAAFQGEQVPRLLATQLALYVETLPREARLAFEAAPALVAQVRRRLDRPPSIEGVYDRIRREGQDQFPAPFTLQDTRMPTAYLSLFDESPGVPGFFTKAGWEYGRQAIAASGRDPEQEDWVLERPVGQLPSSLGNPETLTAELERRYFIDYAEAWEQFLAGLAIKPFGNLGDADEAMQVLMSDSDSPLLYVLSEISEQTHFEEAPGLDAVQQGVEQAVDQAAGQGQGANVDAARRLGEPDAGSLNPVDRRFRELHALKAGQAPSGGADQALYEALSSLGKVSGAVGGLATGQDAAAYTGTVLEARGSEMDEGLRTIRSSLSGLPDVRRLFEAPVLSTWEVVLAEAQQYLDERWQDEVYKPFQQTLAAYYPFDPNNERDAPLRDVEQYFKPAGGTVATFIEEELRPFVERDLGQAKVWENRGLNLSEGMKTLQDARRIQAGLFNGNEMRLSFQLRPEQPEKSEGAPPPDIVTIDIQGQVDEYDMGHPSYRAFEWPNRSPRASLTVKMQGEVLPQKRFEGDWAFFRLLSEAQVMPRTSAEYQLRWVFQKPGRYDVTALYDLKTSSSSNPFENPRTFFRFSLSPTLE